MFNHASIIVKRNIIQTNMKKLFLLASMSAALFTSCTKDDTAPMASSSSSKVIPGITAVSPIPSSFLKKILVEEYIGGSYGATPDASNDLRLIQKANPDRVYSVGYHVDDYMETSLSAYMIQSLTSSTPPIPCGSVDRKTINGNIFTDSKSFGAVVMSTITKPSDAGLAIESTMNGLNATIQVHAGFLKTPANTMRLHVFIVEDKVASRHQLFEQVNNFNNTAGSPFFNAGNPIRGYQHNNVMRRALSDPMGEVIPPTLTTAGSVFTKNYGFDTPKKIIGSSKYVIIAFMTDDLTKQIVNVQQAEVGTIKDWN